MSAQNKKQYSISWLNWILLMIVSLILLGLNATSKEFNTVITNAVKYKAITIRYFFDDGIYEYFTDISDKSNTIKQLREENLQLKQKLSNANILEIENKYLENKINFLNEKINFIDNKNIDSIVTTTVISNSLGSITKNISIGVGEINGIENNLLVLTNKGIVGYTYDTKSKSSKVLTILDNNFRLSAITGKTKVNIVISGNRTLTPDVKLYSQGIPIEEGEIVYTSGLEGTFPVFIAIGKVIKNPEQEDSWKISLFEDLKELNYVYIVK